MDSILEWSTVDGDIQLQRRRRRLDRYLRANRQVSIVEVRLPTSSILKDMRKVMRIKFFGQKADVNGWKKIVAEQLELKPFDEKEERAGSMQYETFTVQLPEANEQTLVAIYNAPASDKDSTPWSHKVMRQTQDDDGKRI